MIATSLNQLSAMPKGVRSNSLIGSSSNDDLRRLIVSLEEKVMSRLDSIEAKVSAIDSRLDKIQFEQIRLKSEFDAMKDLVISQQRQIESIESVNRACFAIFSGVPENDIEFGRKTLETDSEKVLALCQQADLRISEDSIESCMRIGNKDRGRSRLLKVKFSEAALKHQILRSQKILRENSAVMKVFGRVYVNPDSTFLMRKEKKRLRDKLKEMKSSAQATDQIYIRRDALIFNDKVLDKINIANQLF